MYQCASCQAKPCRQGGSLNTIACPSNHLEGQQKAKDLYRDPLHKRLAIEAAGVEARGYGEKTRIEEIIDFARSCQFEKLGLLFCVGLSTEAAIVEKIFKAHRFQVISVACKNGGMSKGEIGIPRENTLSGDRTETMCNPIGQALFLNEQKSELNILLGLCVGHDVLATKHLEAPVTTLAVKDRVTGHNPLAPVYLAHSYYKRLLTDDLVNLTVETNNDESESRGDVR